MSPCNKPTCLIRHIEGAEDIAHYHEERNHSDLIGRPYHEIGERLQALEETRVQGAPQYAEGTRLALPSVSRFARRTAETEALVGVSKIAAAVGLHRLRNGSYPVSLDTLGADLPVDPFTGRPYVYRREGTGFVVYSVGEDGVDGAGSQEHDVVFRSPR